MSQKNACIFLWPNEAADAVGVNKRVYIWIGTVSIRPRQAFSQKIYAYIAREFIDFRMIYMYIIDTNVRFDEEKALRVLWNNLS